VFYAEVPKIKEQRLS